MAAKQRVTFRIGERNYKADGIAAIVQRENGVEVRYGDGSNPLLITNTTVERVTLAVDEAKAARR